VKILIAEDDFTSRTMLTAVLQKFGHEVVVTSDGAEAWEVLQRPGAPRLAILDWMMPGLDGVEVCLRVRALETDRPPYLVLLTARNEKKNIVEGLFAGADDYMVKPYDAEELKARIEVGSRIIKLQDRLTDKVQELCEALEQVKTLEGILPICCYCKKIRDDGNYWRQLEEYVSSRSKALFSHGICPECMKKHYPEFVEDEEARMSAR
jgi:DNA-binding response OmpR family regulator